MKSRIWQLPVKQSNLTDHDWIHRGAKYHAFIDNESICGKYDQNTGFFETSIDEKEIQENPNLACKKCVALASDYYCNNCGNSRYFYNEVSIMARQMIDNKQGKQHNKIMHIDTTNVDNFYEENIYCYKCETQVSEPIFIEKRD